MHLNFAGPNNCANPVQPLDHGRAGRTRTHKLILEANGSEEFYDLLSDPREELPLALPPSGGQALADYNALKTFLTVTMAPGC
jgi:hypothetical protein